MEDIATATSADGSVFVAWTRGRRVRATTVSRSGRVGATVTLGRSLGVTALKVVRVDSGYEGFTPSPEPSLAISRDGRALVGWHRFHDFNYEARLVAARPGHTFGPPRDLDAQELGDVGFDHTRDTRTWPGRTRGGRSWSLMACARSSRGLGFHTGSAWKCSTTGGCRRRG